MSRSVRLWDVWRCRHAGVVLLHGPGVCVRAVECVVLVWREAWTRPGAEKV